MSDAEDDYFGADNGIDTGGYGYCPHWEEYGYCHGDDCRGPEAVDPPGTFYTADGQKGHGFFLTPKMIIDARKSAPIPAFNPFMQYPTLQEFDAQFVPHNNKEYAVDIAGIAKMRSDLEAMLGKLASMVAVVERFGGEPADGSVIKFEHEFDTPGRSGDTVYTYVAIRRGAKWYVSGKPFGGRAIAWSELLEFIGDGRAWICREFEEAVIPGEVTVAVGETERRDATAAAVTELLKRARADGRNLSDIADQLMELIEKA